MTKVIVIGEKPQKVEKKPIEFLYCWGSSNRVMKVDDNTTASDYKFVELICLNYFDEYDLMFAYYDPENRGAGVLYLGKFNDGVVK